MRERLGRGTQGRSGGGTGVGLERNPVDHRDDVGNESSGIGQVNTAVTQMDQVVQQNASLVEEATAATESMKQQAGSLLQLVSRFRLGATNLGQAAPERAKRWRTATPRKAAPPAPIQVKANPLRLTSGFGELSPSLKSARDGQ